MTLFKKLFGNKQEAKSESTIDRKGFKVTSKLSFSNFSELLEQNGAFSFEKQKVFNELTGSSSWNIDLSKGLITFGTNNFSFDVIGSLSFSDSSWMWAWANERGGIPTNLIKSSLNLKSIGEQKDIEELRKGHFSVEEGFEHKMGLIATGLLNADAYFCANYGKGTMLITITSGQLPKIEKNSLDKVLTTFPQFISSFEMSHKQAFLNYLIDRDAKIKSYGNSIEGLRNGKVLTGQFDDLERMKTLKG